MRSITCGVGYFLTILAVVFSSDYHFLSEPNVTLTYFPLYFYYKSSHDFLIMEIILKNISPSVTAAHLQYYYEDYQHNNWSLEQEVKVNIEKPANEVKFMILKHLHYDHIMVYVELHSQSEICNKTYIAEGRDESSFIKHRMREYFYNDKYENVYKDQDDKYYFNYCLALRQPCQIVMDLKDKCQETLPSCYIELSQYICTFSKQQKTTTFYQTNEDGSSIGPVLETEMTTTKVVIKLELFDNNTSVKIATNNGIKWDEKLSFFAEDIKSEDYGHVPKLKYSETTDVEYSCPNMYKTYIVHVGLITTDNKIKTQNTTLIQKFKMADNGTILCCIYYRRGSNGVDKDQIARIVHNKTLLFYESIPTNLTESKGQVQAFLEDWWIYIVLTFLGMSVLMLTLYIIKQKQCCTNSQPAEDSVELDNYATQNPVPRQSPVLYANLDVVRDEHQPESQHEESPYANIIGSLHPH